MDSAQGVIWQALICLLWSTAARGRNSRIKKYSATANSEGEQSTDGEVPVFVSNLPKTPARQSARISLNKKIDRRVVLGAGTHQMDLCAGTYISNQRSQKCGGLAGLVRCKSSRHLESHVKYVKRQRRRNKHTIHPKRRVRISMRTNKRPMILMILTVLALPPCE